MYTIRKQFKFEASHQLMDHDGKCARLHGHSWVMWVEVRGDSLFTDGPKRNMLMDYADLKIAVKPLVSEFLDHHHLNDTLSVDMPTSEYIAEWAYDKLFAIGVPIFAIEIEETCTSMCRFEPESSDPGIAFVEHGGTLEQFNNEMEKMRQMYRQTKGSE